MLQLKLTFVIRNEADSEIDACMHYSITNGNAETRACLTIQMLINTDLWICVYISYVDTFALQIVLHVSIGHEGQDHIWREVRGVKTHSEETQDVVMTEIFHNETFGKEILHLILRYKVCAGVYACACV